MNSDNIKIRSIKSEDIESVAEFIKTHFVRDETLSSLEPKLIVTENIINGITAVLEAGMSVMAVDDSDGSEKLVGVNIAMPISTKSVAQENLDKAELNKNTKYGQMLELSGMGFKNADISNRYDVDEVFYSYMSCVEPNSRGKNIGGRMKKELMAIGKKLGYPMMAIQCTGYYSACVVERMGWENVYNINYKDYVDDKGEPIFKPELPHVAFRIFIVRL